MLVGGRATGVVATCDPPTPILKRYQRQKEQRRYRSARSVGTNEP